MPGIGSILRDCHVPWPEGNEGDLREAAMVWHRLADALSDGCGRANSAAASLTSNNEGNAIDAFERYWDKYGNRGKGVLTRAAEACDAMGNACTRYADEIASAKSQIEEAGAEIGATLAIGTIGAFFTFGAAEGGADAISAGLLDYAADQLAVIGARMATSLGELSATVGEAISTATQALATSMTTAGSVSALGSAIVGGVNGVGSATLNAIADNEIQEFFGDKPLSAGTAAKDLFVGGVLAGGAGGLLGKLSGLGQLRLAALLKNTASAVSDSDIRLSTQMLELARQVEGAPGKITADVLTKAATQLITAQQVNADKIVEGEIPKLIERGAERNHG